MKRTTALLVVVVVVVAAAALLLPVAAGAEPPEGEVLGVRLRIVYVSLGAAHGVRADDTLQIVGSPVRLKVVHIGEKQAAARVVGDGPVRRGDRVRSPRLPPTARTITRPVVVLTPPPPVSAERASRRWHLPARAPWLDSGRGGRTAPKVHASGDLTLMYYGVTVPSMDRRELHSLRLRSRLAVEDMAAGHLAYRHDVAGRLDLGPDLARRGGADSRPYYELREVRLRYRSRLPTDEPPRLGTFTGDVGRVINSAGAGPAVLDGGAASVALGRGVDMGYSADVGVGGGYVSWAGDGDRWQAFASLSADTTVFRGSFSRSDLALTGSVSYLRLLTFDLSVVGTVFDDPTPLGTTRIELTHGFLGFRIRPLAWLTIDGHYAHHQDVPDLELLAAIGPHAVIDYPRESAWLQLRFEPHRRVSIGVSGFYGFGDPRADQGGAGAQLVLRSLALAGDRLGFGYRFDQTDVTQLHQARTWLAVPVASAVELGAGYAFDTFLSRRLGERRDEHRVEASVDLLLAGAWRAHVDVSAVVGGEVPVTVAMVGLLSWRF